MPTRSQSNQARPQPSQARPLTGPRQDRSRGPIPTQRPVVRSEPIVRTQPGARPMSLSQLQQRGEVKKESSQANVDVLGLRKALDAALGERASPRQESGRAAPISEPRPDGREALKDRGEGKKSEKKEQPSFVKTTESKEKKVIGPGETVRF